MFSAARWRLTATFALILAVVLIVAGSIVYFTTRSLILDRVSAELADKADSQMFLLDDREGHGPAKDEDVPQFDPGGYFYAVVDSNGDVSESSYGFQTSSLASQDTIDAALRDGSATEDVESNNESQRVYVVASHEDDGQLLEIGRSIEAEQGHLAQLRNILLAVAALSFVPIIAGGYLISGRVLRPIKSAVDAQRAFIADASHELRTPVAVVRTNAELLERRMASGASKTDATAVADILQETERLAKMVNQMLTLAQSETGRRSLSRSDVELNEVAADVVHSLRSVADAKGISLQMHTDAGAWVSADRTRLREAIVTVVDNAVKYTPAGRRVDVRIHKRHRKASITVRDTGPGIPRESIERIFERFYRVDQARSRDEGGTGLGLAIARQVVEAHGGHIHAESTLGNGTSVSIELALAHHGRLRASEFAEEAGA